MDKKISIVIPTYVTNEKQEAFLKKAIESVLMQKYDNYEIIVSLHTSDGYINLNHGIGIDKIKFYCNQNNLGSPTHNLNNAILHATGDIIKPLFYDDFMVSDETLAKINEAFNKRSTHWVVIGNYTADETQTNLNNPFIPRWNNEIILGKNTLSSPSCIAYRSDCGFMFDDKFTWLLDCVFYQKLYNKYGSPVIIPDLLIANTRHEQQTTNILTQDKKNKECKWAFDEYGRDGQITKGIDVLIDESVKIKNHNSVVLGDHIGIGNNTYISTQLICKSYVHISPNVCIIGGDKSRLVMHDCTFISANSTIICGSDNFKYGLVNSTIPEHLRKVNYSTVIMYPFSGIGANSCIMPSVAMAEGSVLGANSLLMEDTEKWTIYAGSPAMPIGKRDKKGILESYENLTE